MRRIGAVALALLIAGCAGTQPGVAVEADTASAATTVPDKIANATSFAGKAAAANEVCAEDGQTPGTAAHAACVKRLLRAEGQRTRDLAASLAARAARNNYICLDKDRLRLVRCYDI
jgi:hypothetical protein